VQEITIKGRHTKIQQHSVVRQNESPVVQRNRHNAFVVAITERNVLIGHVFDHERRASDRVNAAQHVAPLTSGGPLSANVDTCRPPIPHRLQLDSASQAAHAPQILLDPQGRGDP
jgi:hypothetical protein